jgi:hypothetical protein
VFRNMIKGFIIAVMFGDILCVFAIDPKIALGRIIVLIAIVWAWKLY